MLAETLMVRGQGDLPVSDYYDDLIWRALCNHETFGGGKYTDKLEPYIKRVVDEYRDILDAAAGWKKILWKNGPVYIEVAKDNETYNFLQGFDHKVAADGMLLTHANSCSCGFFSMSNGPEKTCPLCSSKVTAALLGSNQFEYHNVCACGHQNKDISKDVCEDCGCDALSKVQGRQIGRDTEVSYINIFHPPPDIELPFFEELLKLWQLVEQFLKSEYVDEEDLNEQCQKLYTITLKRDRQIAQGKPKRLVENLCKKYDIT